MKIETWLQPNCSEAVIVVVDWTKKQVIESYDASSESTDNDAEIERIQGFVSYIKAGYHVDINANGTGMFDDEFRVAKAIVNNDLTINDWNKLIEDFFENVDQVINHIADYDDKVERFAKGGFKKKGGKKNAT
jgi:hypothetical protein